ncbi:MAG: glycoside hydrolase family 38 C-terminal domain-containing protein [Fibrobacterota bacterium]
MKSQILGKEKMFLAHLETLRFQKLLDLPLRFTETDVRDFNPPGKGFRPIPLPHPWGSNNATGWFAADFTVPVTGKDRELFVSGELGGEAVIMEKGRFVGGLDVPHKNVRIRANGRAGERIRIVVPVYAGHVIPGVHFQSTPHILNASLPGFPVTARNLSLLAGVPAIDRLYWDMTALIELAQNLDENSLRRERVLSALSNMLAVFPYSADTLEAAVACAQKAARILAPVLKARNGDTMPCVTAVGHSHLDIAWLWPRNETTRKFARTFSTVLNLMERYPAFRFVQTQGYIYETVKKEYPRLFASIQKAVQRGRWEPNAAMWVEADCNVTSGESLVRQFLFGKRLMKKMFNADPDTLLLPDVFGYSAALPQIMKLARVRYFVTAKIRWNDTTTFPFSTFRWQGIDGTEVLSQFMPNGNYNGKLSPEFLIKQWALVMDKSLGTQLHTIGYGDGGGGPTDMDNEMANRMKDLEGCPRVSFGSMSGYLKSLEGERERLPLHSGELYLEYHRGTLTSQARTKRYNRKLEFLLRDAEFFSALAMRKERRYPALELEGAWKTLLTNQFHDIIPGSSIEAVNQQAVEEYEKVEADVRALVTRATAALGRKRVEAVTVFNTLSLSRADLAVVPGVPAGSVPVAAEGTLLPCQFTGTGKKRTAHVRLPLLPFSSTVLRFKKGRPASGSPFNFSGRSLETPFYRVRFDAAYRIASFVDKARGRELVKAGAVMNDLRTADDVSVQWLAWDIDRDYRRKESSEARLVSARPTANGPLFFTLRVVRTVGKRSTVAQDIIFYADSPRVDFDTTVDWDEKLTLLRVYFPTPLHVENAAFDTQFGYLERSTHDNNAFEEAKFEVCGHKWADLSEESFGAALLNDCKYGYRVKEGELSLSLLKSADRPDARCEKGRHRFTYSFMAHAGLSDRMNVVREAFQLNVPMRAVAGLDAELPACFSASGDGVIIDTIKKAEDSTDWVVRLYETLNRNERVTLKLPAGVKRVFECNILEERLSKALPIRKGSINFTLKPFEIKSFIVCF